MTREHGTTRNTRREAKRSLMILEKGENVMGRDKFMKSHRDMMMRLKKKTSQETKDQEEEDMKDLLTNENYADQTMRERIASMKLSQDQMQEVMDRDNEMKLQQILSMSEIQYKWAPVSQGEGGYLPRLSCRHHY